MAYINSLGQTRLGVRLGVAPTITSKLLDTYSGADAAYSLRKLSTTYSGSAIRVRRSSDNGEQNIGFDGDGNLDTTSLLSFVGSGNGYVKTWYDQSGNNKYAYNNASANQPIIVLSGVVQMNGNKPSIYWDNSQQQILYINSIVWSGIESIRSVFINMKWLTGSGRNPILGETSDAMYHADTTSANLILSEAYANYNIKYGALYLNNVSKNVNNFYRNPNNNQIISMVHLSQSGYFNRLSIDRSDASSYFKGYYSEIVIYTSNQTNNVSGINGNMNTYYSIYPATVSDTDAQAFLNAAFITSQTQANAINTLVTDLKTAGVWTKMMAIYPFVGGNATSHKFNLKDPRDLNDSFRLKFNGGWTHSSTGILPNGSNAFAETFLATRSWMSGLDSLHISFYSRTDVTSGGCDIGSGQNPVYFSSIYSKYNNAGTISTIASLSSDFAYIPNNTPSNAFYLVNRNSISQISLFRNSTKVSLTNLTRNYNSGMPFTISALNQGQGTVPNTSSYSSRESAFASIGYGLTDVEALSFYNAIQAYQTTLGRQV